MKSFYNSIFTMTDAFALAMVLAVSAQAGGNVLHLDISQTMTNEGVEPHASGSIKLSQNQQGNANNQTLEITLKGLTRYTAYQLVAAVDEDTNYVPITVFTTDYKGRADLNYKSNAQGIGNAPTGLPTSLNPVSLIREVDIFNVSTQAVLTADLSQPDKLQYLVKQDLSTNNVKSSLQIQATNRKTQFRLLCSGLTDNSNYLLVLNGDVTETTKSTAHGKLNIYSEIVGASYVLDLRSLALWDSSSNVVVETELP